METLSDKNLLVIFTYAPAGLGHLRVTDALYHALPSDSNALILGSHDKTITFFHRLTSASIFGRRLIELFQYGLIEDIFTAFYRSFLYTRSGHIYRQLLTLLEQHINLPQTVVIVSTHFAMAHQIAHIKEKLEKTKNVKIYLFVQVTDDSPQKIWYIAGADLLFVPSLYTKNVLSVYAKATGLKKVPIEIIPYPVDLSFSKISMSIFDGRIASLNAHSKANLNIMIPVAGAAVGLSYYADLIGYLSKKIERGRFFVVSKDSKFTKDFLLSCKKCSQVNLHTFSEDRAVVDAYEEIYRKENIQLEITKPSEQAFKALLPYDRKGGAILLFTEPVGRQERDNLAFLIHHDLIPKKEDNDKLIKILSKENPEFKLKDVLEKMRGFRGLCLPSDPRFASIFIENCLKNNLFYYMVLYGKRRRSKDKEVAVDGVEEFWKKVGTMIKADHKLI